MRVALALACLALLAPAAAAVDSARVVEGSYVASQGLWPFGGFYPGLFQGMCADAPTGQAVAKACLPLEGGEQRVTVTLTDATGLPGSGFAWFEDDGFTYRVCGALALDVPPGAERLHLHVDGGATTATCLAFAGVATAATTGTWRVAFS